MGEEAKQEEAKVEVKPEEEKKEEEKKDEEKKEEEKKEEEKPPLPFVISLDLHCAGCAKKIEKSILKIRGVEGVMTDMEKNQVTIKGVVEPQAVCDKIMKRTKRSAQVLSPLPASEGEPMPELVNSQVSGLTTVELNVNMHCEACAEQLKKKILKMRGVRTAETELSSSKVTVTGTMDPNTLVEYVYRRTKKQAKIVPQPEPEPEPKPEEEKEEKAADPEPKPEEKKEEAPAETTKEKKEGEVEKKEEKSEENKEEVKKEVEEEQNNMMVTDEQAMQRMVYYYQPLYVIERIPHPQLFSDENPNACCIT